MNLRKGIFLLPLLMRLIKCDQFLENFTRDYFDSIHVYQLIVFGCWNLQEVHDFARNVMRQEAKVSYNEIRDNINLENTLRLNAQTLGVILDFDCPSSDLILNQFSRQLAFNESYRWILLTESLEFPTPSLRDLPLSVASEMIVAIRQNNTYKLYDVYNPSYRHGGVINVTLMGYWTPEHKLVNNFKHQFKYHRRQNFNLLPLNVSVALVNEPKPDLETYLTTPIDIHLDTMSRFTHQIVLQLQEYYNFSINIKRDKSWGYKVNGSFNGIIGDMEKGIVDISSAPFQFKRERLEVIDYTVHVMTIRTVFFFRHPKKDYMQNGFLKPFDSSLWYIVFGVAGVYWFILFITTKAESHVKNIKVPDNSSMSLPATETSLITLAALFQQGVNDSPRLISGRIAFLSLFVWTLLLFQFYSATVVGFLLAPPAFWITTLKNLTDSSLSCGMEDMDYYRDFYATTYLETAIEMHEKKIKPTKKLPRGSYYPAVEGLLKVRDEPFAFHIEDTTAYRIIEDLFTEDQMCELQEIPIRAPREVYVGVPRHSPFKEIITYGCRKSVEHGLANRLRKHWRYKKPPCPESHSSKPIPVMMKEFAPALMFLSFGFGLSVFILFVECIYHAKFDRDSNESDNQSITPVQSAETTEQHIEKKFDHDETVLHFSA
ncbi:hypothetical protein G9C98_007036 [Cotesia typhae]|uniref:Uncharacterized protein n=1 Tax=Cotesia typhae TaxID=2053667 RepID=A0A8J5UTN7_9HYME|nr:hypothetical protein G9C98_007036 [Cotesia typhae]